ncbi:hypothetical protein [Paenibacillus lutimineralis]|uniref:hypothetical protein n=1 Tax=Paenibacillus lutimineralis TaxID=2707005 RepID=UPI001F2B23B6|nr:hypothetical protein [Paenibacillus lutimineralis]
MPADASGWTRWDFWQYSDGSVGGVLPSGTRKVNGINGNVDLNEYDGTIADLKRWYTNKPIEKGEEMTGKQERDINVVSTWAADDWSEAKVNDISMATSGCPYYARRDGHCS